uniref:Retrotransposon protein, putative, unclassified n=1 Tax=Oryza sativa subsp. japonica TaxID=39947 RepID=Q2QS91_ORYSJ|nr:retrotransposon protein, putative, unclassified [Oryza sativa Japonica Group]
MIADVMREQFGLKPKDDGNLYRHPYPKWFERVPLPNRFKVSDFSKFSGQDSVSTYEHRFAEARKNFKKVNHVCPYIYGSDDHDDDSEVAAAEQQIQAAIEGGKIKFDDSKKPMRIDGNPFPVNMVHTAGRTADGRKARGAQINSARIINKYQKKYDKQQVKHYEEDNGGFDPHWGCEFFRLCWNEGMRLPSIEDCLGCSNIAESSSRSYNMGNRLRQARVPVHQRLGLVNQDCDQGGDEDIKNQWCPSGIFTKNQKRRVQRLRNRERFQEVEQEINHRLKKTKPRQEWRVKNQVAIADEVYTDEAKRLAKGKSVVTTSANMVFMLRAEFGANQADVDEVEEESAMLVLSPEQAVFEKPEGTENRHLKPLYINGYVNGKPMSRPKIH